MVRLIKSIILSFFSFLIFSNTSFSQIATDRPDQTESSSTVPLGALQLESGILVGYVGEGDFSASQILLPTNLFRYGLTKGIELRLVNQLERFEFGGKGRYGISDLQIGTKIQLLKNENKNTEIAFLSHLIVPTGSSDFSIDTYGTFNKLCISHSISDNVGIGYNLGYNHFGIGDGELTYTLSLGVRVNDKIGLYIEPYGSLVDFEDHVASFDAGFTYLITQDIQADFSFGTGINHTMNYFSVGCSWLMKKND